MRASLLGAAAMMAAATSGTAQQPSPTPTPGPVTGGDNGGMSAKDRTWYPKTDVIKPDEVLGAFFVISDDKVMHILLQPPIRNNFKIPVDILKADPSYQFNRTKGQSAGASVPIIALSADVSETETQSGTVVDIAHAVIPAAQQWQFCEQWPNLRHKWRFKEGDIVYYINRATISTVSWKIGKEHDASAGFSIGNYFSANGKQYDEKSTSAVVSAMSFDTIDSMVTRDSLAGRCPTHRIAPMVRVRPATIQPLRVVRVR